MNTVILLVEDDAVARESESFRLKRAGHQVSTAASIREAVNYLEHLRPDVALIDMGLPDGDGFELGRWLRATNVPFIFTTARSSIDDRVRGLNAGADDYLVKPFGMDEMVARVNALLRRVVPPWRLDSSDSLEFT